MAENRRAEDQIREQVETDPAKIIADFAREIDHRIKQLEWQLRWRYVMFIVGFLIGAAFLWHVSANASDVGQRAADLQESTASLTQSNRTLIKANHKLTLEVAANQQKIATNQRRNTTALCALQGVEEKRAAQGQAFLADHPNGIPGIPAAALRLSVATDSAARTALQSAHLVCSKPHRHR